MKIKATNKLLSELRNLRAKNKFEISNGQAIFRVGEDIGASGDWTVQQNGGLIEPAHNIIVTEGLNYMLDVALGGATQYATFYVAPFSGNVTPVNTWTAANFTANSTENTGYSSATRVAFVDAAASGGSMTNSASKAEFTFNATATVYGAGLLSSSAKSSTAGVLYAAVRFATSKNVVSTDVINVGYTVTLTSV